MVVLFSSDGENGPNTCKPILDLVFNLIQYDPIMFYDTVLGEFV